MDATTTLEQLEGAWPEPGEEATGLMRQVYAARRVPLGTLSTEQLRVLLGQHESLDVLVPLALDRLSLDPLAEGAYYPGDLLSSVLTLPDGYWTFHSDQATMLRSVLVRLDPDGDDFPVGTNLAPLASAFLAR